MTCAPDQNSDLPVAYADPIQAARENPSAPISEPQEQAD